MLGRADDIGNQDCGQDALVSERRLCASEEFNDLVCDLIGVITKEWKIIDFGNSRNRAFGMLLANCRPPSILTTGSLIR